MNRSEYIRHLIANCKLVHTPSIDYESYYNRLKCIRTAFEEGKLDYDTVTEIMAEAKPNQVEKLKIPMDDIRKYVPSSMTPAEMLEYLLKLVKREYDRQHNRDVR